MAHMYTIVVTGFSFIKFMDNLYWIKSVELVRFMKWTQNVMFNNQHLTSTMFILDLLWGVWSEIQVLSQTPQLKSTNTRFQWLHTTINTLRPRQNGRHFANDTFKYIFLNENVIISAKISLKFVSKGPIDNIPALVQIMAWRRPGDKPLS